MGCIAHFIGYNSKRKQESKLKYFLLFSSDFYQRLLAFQVRELPKSIEELIDYLKRKPLTNSLYYKS